MEIEELEARLLVLRRNHLLAQIAAVSQPAQTSPVPAPAPGLSAIRTEGSVHGLQVGSPFDGSCCFPIAGEGGDGPPSLSSFRCIRLGESDVVVIVGDDVVERVVQLSEVETLAKLSAKTVGLTTPLSVSANKIRCSDFIKVQLQRGAVGSFISVANILCFSQQKVGHLANITVGPSERISEAAAGTCSARHTESILALANFNFMLSAFGVCTELRREMLLGYNRYSASALAQSSPQTGGTQTSPKKVILLFPCPVVAL